MYPVKILVMQENYLPIYDFLWVLFYAIFVIADIVENMRYGLF